MQNIVKKIKKGDQQAFKVLFNEFYVSLCVFAENFVNDEALAADCAQEAFVSLWKKHEDFDNIYKLKSFLYKVVRNSCLNYIRNNRTVCKELVNLESEQFFRDKLIEEESYRIFYNAIETLPGQTQKVIKLSLEGLKNAEIAEQLEVAPSTIHTLKKIAYKRLKAILKEHYYLIHIFLH